MNREQFSELMRSWLARIPIRELRDPAPGGGVLRRAGMSGRVGPAGGGMTLAGLERAIDKAFASRNLVAVALAVNSPGGSPVQSARRPPWPAPIRFSPAFWAVGQRVR